MSPFDFADAVSAAHGEPRPEAPRYRHIGYAKYLPSGFLMICGPNEPGAFRVFKNPADGVLAIHDKAF